MTSLCLTLGQIISKPALPWRLLRVGDSMTPFIPNGIFKNHFYCGEFINRYYERGYDATNNRSFLSK